MMKSVLFQSLLLFLLLLLRSYDCQQPQQQPQQQQQQQQQQHQHQHQHQQQKRQVEGVDRTNTEDRSSFEYHEDIEHFKETEGVEWSALGDSSAPSTTSYYNQDNDAIHNGSTTNSDGTGSFFIHGQILQGSVLNNGTFFNLGNAQNIKNDSTILTARYKMDASSENNNSSSSTNNGNDNDVILAQRRIHKKDGSASMDADEGAKKVSKGTEVNNDLWTDEEFYMKENADDEVKAMEKALQDEDVRVWRDESECDHALNEFRVRGGMRLIAEDEKMSRLAEKWAVFLASKIETLSKNSSKMIYMSSYLEKKLGFGMLIYYAQNIIQGPGCNMAISAFLRELEVKTNDDIHHYGPERATKAVAGDFRQLFWKHTKKYGVGISYNKKKLSGFVVMLFTERFINGTSKLGKKLPDKIGVTYWQLLLQGYRNPLMKEANYETNIHYTPCLSRFDKCDEWANDGHCNIPAFRRFMTLNCFRSCSGCKLDVTKPVDGGWSNWAIASPCSVSECGGGHKIHYRFCNLPPKLFGGKDCAGYRVKYAECHMEKCDLTEGIRKTCIDWDLNCAKRKKLCDHVDYGAYMKQHCKKTCKAC